MKKQAKKTVKKPNKKPHPKKGLFLTALQKSLGNISDAAKATGINRSAHYDWMKDDPEYKAAYESIECEAIDFVESKLFELIKGVEIQETKFFVVDKVLESVTVTKKFAPDTASVIFYLKTKGKSRGYVEKNILSLETGDIKSLSEEDLDKIILQLEEKTKAKK